MNGVGDNNDEGRWKRWLFWWDRCLLWNEWRVLLRQSGRVRERSLRWFVIRWAAGKANDDPAFLKNERRNGKNLRRADCLHQKQRRGVSKRIKSVVRIKTGEGLKERKKKRKEGWRDSWIFWAVVIFSLPVDFAWDGFWVTVRSSSVQYFFCVRKEYDCPYWQANLMVLVPTYAFRQGHHSWSAPQKHIYIYALLYKKGKGKKE